MEQPDRILIVDDDREIRELLTAYLQRNGLQARAAADAEEFWSVWQASAFDLVVLDVMMPGQDGLALCRDLRARSQVPVIMLTALGDEMDRILGLEMGADDYLPKPFNPRELLARIKVVLRRTRPVAAQANRVGGHQLVFAGWRYDPDARQLFDPSGQAVTLSSGELRLLQVFLEHPGRPLTRDQLSEWLLGREYLPSDRGIDVQVSRLRRRLKSPADEQSLIRTVRNVGYLLACRVEASSP